MNHAGVANAGAPVPNFLDDPGTCLQQIANRPASRDLWALLADQAAPVMKDEAQQNNPMLCALFLQAVAQQLPASDLGVEASAVASSNNNNNSGNNSMKFEMLRAQRLFDVLDAVSAVATKTTPRATITQSGILRSLLVHPQFKSSYLTQVHVEFCQMALLAEQYRFAARTLKGSWPRPSSTLSVRHILRYFLFRGMIHVGCNDWAIAKRCFWTCLSIPSEVVSALAVAAWKKLVLVQCLQMEDDDFRSAQEYALQHQQRSAAAVPHSAAAIIVDGPVFGNVPSATAATTAAAAAMSGRGPLSLPKAVPNCFSRFLSMASSNKQQQQQQRTQQQQQQGTPQPEDASHHMVQEDLGEPSAQQQQQQRQQPYAAMGVRVYMDLVYSFVSGDRAQFQSLLQQHTALLRADSNFGLVRQCETAMMHRQVYQISRMFSVIPLTDLATELHVESVDSLKELLQQLSLQKMQGQTKWPSIEIEDDGMVVFSFDSGQIPEEFRGMVPAEDDNDNCHSELESNIQELVQLTKTVEKLDVGIATSPMYHAFVRRANEAKMGGPRGVEEL